MTRWGVASNAKSVPSSKTSNRGQFPATTCRTSVVSVVSLTCRDCSEGAWACTRSPNPDNFLTTKIHPYRLLSQVFSRARRVACPSWGWGQEARRAALHHVQLLCTCARSKLQRWLRLQRSAELAQPQDREGARLDRATRPARS